MSATAVRVALRVRPLTQKEVYSSCTECITFIDHEPQITIGRDHSFTYDYVFDPQSSQQSIYDSSVSPLVEKFVDGFNATILAYGQTGSGKTFSMGTALDGNLHSEQQGIVPRFITDLFMRMDHKHEQSHDDYQVYVSFLELYNEDFVDLLSLQDATSSFGNGRRRTNSGGLPPGGFPGGCEISIREDVQGNIYWTGVREEPCSDPDQLLSLLARGSLCRTTGSTDMNAVSSRSHAIFSVILKQQVADDYCGGDASSSPKRTIVSKFHFVDLAGSERLKRTNAQGDRAREGIAINSGLLALGNVISALGDESRKSSHIPYRDSKLTRLLQDSLGGNSQTLMMACVSPSDSNFPETLSTLKYANRARNIKNKVSINEECNSNNVEINRLRSQVAHLRMELNNVRGGGVGGSLGNGGPSDLTALRALREEINRLRDRNQLVSDELRNTATERDTLLVERDLNQWSANDWPRLWEELDQLNKKTQGNGGGPGSPTPTPSLIQPDQTTPLSPPSLATIDGPSATVNMIAQYQRTIQQLRDELGDTQDRLAFFESTQAPMMQALASQLAPSDSLFSSNNNPPKKKNGNGRQSPSLGFSQKTSFYRNKRGTVKRRAVRHSGSASTRTRRSKVPASRRASPNPDSFRSVLQEHQQKKAARYQPPMQPPALTTDNDNDDIEQWLKETIGPFNDNPTNDIRTEVRDSIQKARSEIEKGLKVLEELKPRELGHVDCDILNDDELFERLRSDESNVYLGDLEQDLPEGLWTDHTSSSQATLSSNDDDLSLTNPHSRTSSVDTASTSDDGLNETELLSLSTRNPQFSRMMDQIQADIHLKEELVTQLEKSEVEYGQLRKRFETKLYSLREEILHLKHEREQAQAAHLLQLQQQQQHIKKQQNRRSSLSGINNTATTSRDHQQLHEVRHAYEAKMKALLTQLSDLRRKYSQTSNAIQASRNQNESMLRALRVNVESLKLEKRRMVKRMKDEAERVKEQMMAHEREIQQLRRKQTRHVEAKHRMEREAKQLQRTLQKRTDESTVTNERLKQLVNILKKAVSEGGVLDDNLISKCASFVNVNHLKSSALVRQQRRSSSNTTRQKKNPYYNVPLEVRATKKKHLLDQALLQFIHGKQAILEMKQLMTKRDVLAGEKSEIMMERADLLQGNDVATDTLDIAVQQCMDERLETIGAEINYINERIHGLQNDAAHGLLQYGDTTDATPGEEDDMMMALEEQSMTSSLANRIEKRVTFADQVMGSVPSNGNNAKHIANAQDTNSNSGWHDIDQLDEKYTLPMGSDPDAAHDMAMQLLHSLTGDESDKMMEALIDDIVALRLAEYGRQTTVRQLEKTVQDLRCTLFIMRKAANSNAAENEKKIRTLEHVRRSSVSSTGSSSSLILPPRRISITDVGVNDDDDSAIDLRGDEQHSGTIFDKIYNDGIRGAIMSPTWNEYHSRDVKDHPSNNNVDNAASRYRNSNGSTGSVTSDTQRRSHGGSIDSPLLTPTLTATSTTSATNTVDMSSNPNAPMRPSVSPLAKRRDSMSSPEQFLQQMLQGGSSTSGMPNLQNIASEFNRYQAERESSTSSISSRHLRRSSFQSDSMTWSSHGSSQHHQQEPVQYNHQQVYPPQQQVQQQQQQQRRPAPLVSSSIANRPRAQSLQLNQYPTRTGRRRSLLRELTLGANIREATTTYGEPMHQPSPLQQQFRFNASPQEEHPPIMPSVQYSAQYSQQQQQQHYQNRPASAMAPRPRYNAATEPRCQTPQGSSVFDRLASAHTHASQARRSPSSLGHRHSSGSFEDLQRRWEYDQAV